MISSGLETWPHEIGTIWVAFSGGDKRWGTSWRWEGKRPDNVDGIEYDPDWINWSLVPSQFVWCKSNQFHLFWVPPVVASLLLLFFFFSSSPLLFLLLLFFFFCSSLLLLWYYICIALDLSTGVWRFYQRRMAILRFSPFECWNSPSNVFPTMTMFDWKK